jgi:hypothetical protein
VDFQLGPEVISSYKRLSYTAWFALAEFVDNSTQAYFNNRKVLDQQYKKEKSQLTVTIEHGVSTHGPFLRITDNSIGMSKEELEHAVIVGKPPKNKSGRSKYGLGLKTGASWFGDLWTVTTKKFGEPKTHKITVDVNRIARNDVDLRHKEYVADRQEHFTTIEIFKLHTRIAPRTIGKVKDYLRSIYRRDIASKNLVLKWGDEVLAWDPDELIQKLVIGRNKEPIKRDFRFRIGRKIIEGWAGVLEKGSRKSAGFSIIQSDRVITGWPDSYRPETLFGSQEGGSNDLVNQRLVGEIVLHGFDVSHTKDEILFDEGEKEVLENTLRKKLSDLRQFALSYRKLTSDERISTSTDHHRAAALNSFEGEMKSAEVTDFLETFEAPPPKLIAKANRALKDSIIERFKPSLKANLGQLRVDLFLIKEMSPNDPYLIIEATQNKRHVVVIINLAHPHWTELTNEESIRNFIRHCTYDGIAEWKAYFKVGNLDPDTIKLIKDNLLRVPLLMEKDKQLHGKSEV